MRLYPDERNALEVALAGIDGEVYLYGSRLYDGKRGGDIDLLILSEKDRLETAMKVKRGRVSNVLLWFDMRDIRNKIVHDYLSEDIKIIYDSIMGPYCTELQGAVRDAIR